ncbi:hypothetical protein [Stenotrophomonas indicatrix]|uniref:hypothetical protein n=1 Tax=Stenotrophomonas indicatrix TaxID=2045451 RepID=UPI003445C408
MVIAAAWLSLNYAEPPNHSNAATAALHGVWVYGLFVTGVLAVTMGAPNGLGIRSLCHPPKHHQRAPQSCYTLMHKTKKELLKAEARMEKERLKEGYIVVNAPADRLHPGDAIEHPVPGSTTRWAVVTGVRRAADGGVELHMAQRKLHFASDHVCTVRLAMANPDILAGMFFRREGLDVYQLDQLRRGGYLQFEDSGREVLSGYGRSQIGLT